MSSAASQRPETARTSVAKGYSGALAELESGDATANAATARAILAGEPGTRRNAVLLNAGAALLIAGVATDLREGVARAAAAIDSGAATERLAQLVAVSQRLGEAEAA